MIALLIGSVIAFLVRLLAKVPFIKAHPKGVAVIVSAIASIVAAWCAKCGSIADGLNQLASQLGALAVATITATAAAVATHEIVLKPTVGPMNAASPQLSPGVRIDAPSPLQGGR